MTSVYRFWFTAIALAACLGVLAGNPAPAEEAAPASCEPITPNAFQGSDIERINQAIAAAAASGRRVVIPRTNHAADGSRAVWLLDSAILVQSGTTLELENCHIKLSDRCRDNFIRSANCGLGIAEIAPLYDIHIRGIGNALLEGADRPRATGDSASVSQFSIAAAATNTATETIVNARTNATLTSPAGKARVAVRGFAAS